MLLIAVRHGSKRAYQTQFRRWNFPSKQNPAHKDDRLVARVKALWERNLSQREMLRTLNEDDGFDIKHRELMRVRTRNRWLLRKPNIDRSSACDNASGPPIQDHEASANAYIKASGPTGTQSPQSQEPEQLGNDPSPETSGPAGQWQEDQESVPDEQLRGRKRRRRTRIRPGQPRFPSETTIDESRVILGLDTKLYQEVRARFARICDEEGVSKKTAAGLERWEDVKGQLIQKTVHLQSVIWLDKENTENKRLALDVICTDVTKRMRSLEQKLTIADAKNVLGINPEEYRTIRQDFVEVLRGDHATSKTAAGSEHWEKLKENWRGSSATLERIFVAAGEEEDSTRSQKLRAVDIVARDVMKRLRDDQSKQQPRKKPTTPTLTRMGIRSDTQGSLEDGDIDLPDDGDSQQIPVDNEFVPPAPTQYQRVSTPMIVATADTSRTRLVGGSPHIQRHEHLQPPRPGMQQHQALQNTLADDQVLTSHSSSLHQTSLLSDNVLSNSLPIDPQINGALPILLNGHGQPLETQAPHSPFPLSQDLPPSMAHSPHPYVQNPYAAQPAPRPPIAVYLRLHPSSPITMAPSIWIATLTARTFAELRQVAVKGFAGTVCGRVEGILGEGMTIEVSRDDELTAYLAVLEGRNSAGMPGPPCFYVQVLPGGWKT